MIGYKYQYHIKAVYKNT